MTPPRRPLPGLALSVVLAMGTLQATAAPPEPVTAYRHARLIDINAATVTPHTTIVVRKERVESVAPDETAQPPPGAKSVDLHEGYVLPGLINTHVHLATEADPPIARAYLRRELFSGVTTVRDMAGDVRLLAELKREAMLDEIVSPDIVYVALFAGPEFFVDPRTHQAARGLVAGEVPWMQALKPETNIALAVAEAAGTGATGLKLYGDLDAAQTAALTAEAHRQHLLVWAHATIFPAKPSEVVAAGVDSVSHACLIGYEVSVPPVTTAEDKRPIDAAATGTNPAIQTVFAAMRQRGIILDATVLVYDSGGAKSCTAEQSAALARAAYQAGVAISVGTDDDPDWSHADSAMDDELALLVEKVHMSRQDALRSATVVGAQVVGQADQLGAVAPGRMANFVVLKRNPLEDIHALHSVQAVIKHGIFRARGSYRPFHPPRATSSTNS